MSLVDLAQDVLTKHEAFGAAKAKADASTAQASVDQAAEHDALVSVESAISALVDAAKAEDPATPTPATDPTPTP